MAGWEEGDGWMGLDVALGFDDVAVQGGGETRLFCGM